MSDRPDNKHPIGPGISPLANSGPAPENEIDPAPQIGVGGTSQTDFRYGFRYGLGGSVERERK